MHWTTLLLLPLLPLASATPKARIEATFSPSCPQHQFTHPSPSPSPSSSSSSSSSLHLDEEFTTAVTIPANKCQGIPVPLSFKPEVDHQSLDAHLLRDPSSTNINAQLSHPHPQCKIALYELPGCAGQPLIEKDLPSARGEDDARSECKPRELTAFTQVFVQLSCADRRFPADGVAHNVSSILEHGRSYASKTGRQARRGWRVLRA